MGLERIETAEGWPCWTRSPGGRCLSRRTAMPEVVRVRADGINEDFPVSPAFHIFAAHKANWWRIDDKLPRHDETKALSTPTQGGKTANVAYSLYQARAC